MPHYKSYRIDSTNRLNQGNLSNKRKDTLTTTRVSNTNDRITTLGGNENIIDSTPLPIVLGNEDGNILTHDLSVVISRLNQHLNNSIKIKKIDATLSRMNTLLNSSSDEKINPHDLGLLSLYMNKLSGLLPKGELKELVKLINIQLEASWVKMKSDQHLIKRMTELQFMKQADAAFKSTTKLGVNIGCGSGAKVNSTGLNTSISAGLETEITHNTFIDDDKTIFSQHISSSSINGGADFDFTAANLNAKAKVKYEKIIQQEFSSLEHLAKNEKVKFSLSKMKHSFIDKLSLKSRKTLHQAQQEAYSTSLRLNDLMQSVLGLNSDVFCIKPVHMLTNIANLDATSIDLGAKTNAGLKDLEAAVEVSANQSITLLGIKAEGYQHFIQDLNRISQLPREFYIKMKGEIDSDNSRKNLLHLLSVLERDVLNYNSVVKRYDGEKLNLNANSHLKQALKAEKHSIEDRWSAIGRHQFLQHAAASHAYIVQNLNQPEIEDTDIIDRCEALIYNPDFSYSAQKLRKLTTLPNVLNLKLIDNKSSFGLSVGPFSGKLEINHRDFKHCSRVKDGKFIQVVITGQASGALSMLNFEQLKTKITETLTSQGLGELVGSLTFTPDMFGNIAVSHTTRWFKPNYSQHDSFPGSKGWRKQFTRSALTQTLGGEISASGGVGVVLGANLGLSKSKTNIISENIGTNDLTCSMMRFNHAYTSHGSTIHNPEWDEFFEQNKHNYIELFKNISEQQGLLAKEVDYFFTELIDRANDTDKAEIIALKENFFSSMKKVNEQPFNQTVFNEAREHFETFLEKQVSPWLDIITEKWWKPDVYKQNTLSANKLGTKVLRVLNLHPRDKDNQEKDKPLVEVSRL
ncbi:hypothetical protein G7083_07180 [Vibrio sp. HDW18]|uniref:hypothetical protein n=1 Tax=Vibrio TaxID=662 RepID=UPI00140D18FA|nr:MULTISPECIES: hypothetical protein [unclassified Vibrio]QIL85653.1 hypothetical protein G7083_07180 [Vibrio sp. HDW18]